eukprot:3668999-Amphidinium_carterae.1
MVWGRSGLNVGTWEALRGELDEELKAKGVSLGDRAKLKAAEDVAIPVKQGNGEVTTWAHPAVRFL